MYIPHYWDLAKILSNEGEISKILQRFENIKEKENFL
jgi:ribosomal protein L31